MNRHTLLYIYIVVCLATCCVACTKGIVYNQYESTPLYGWEHNDTITFQTEAMESAGNYLEEIGLRVNGNYPFMSLSIVVEQTVMPSNKTYTDTLTCCLTDKRGNNTGDGINHFQYVFPFTTLKLDKGECLRVTIHHCMKREILPGIMDVGLKLSHEVTTGIQTKEDEKQEGKSPQ